MLDSETRLLRTIQQMAYDDALHFIGVTEGHITLSPYRLELLYLQNGWIHYRLYHRTDLIGVADVRHSKDIRHSHVDKKKVVQAQLVTHLHTLGLTGAMARVIPYGATTPLDADTTRCPRLFR